MAVVAIGLISGCGSGSTRQRPSTVAPDASGSIYVIRATTDNWRLREARNPTPNSLSSIAEPSLDWFAEYERFTDAHHSERVRLSGHGIASAGLESTFAAFTFERRTGMRWPAIEGTSSAPTEPTLLLLEVVSNYTVMVLSYELHPEALLQWSRQLLPATESAWLGAGGVRD